MKNVLFFLAMFAVVNLSATQKVNVMNVGDEATLTDVKMKCVSGKMVSLAEVKGENGLLVIFSCNTCPFVLRWENRYPELKKYADENGVGMIVLNSNYQKRDGDDSFEAMVAHAKEKGYNFPYVVDEESRIANAFGGQTTPHVFLFDKHMKLAYKGLIDDNAQSAADVKKPYVKDALKSLGNGGKIAVTSTPPKGCSIKRLL